MGKVQRTIKALISKQFASELKTASEPHQWHDTHMGWGLAGASLALVLFAVGVIVPTVIAARVALAVSGVLWVMAMLVMFRDSTSIKRATWTLILSVPMASGLMYLWRYHDPPSDFLASLTRIETMVKEIHDFILKPKEVPELNPPLPLPSPTPDPFIVTARAFLVYEGHDPYSLFMVGYQSPNGMTASPIPYLVYVSITNALDHVNTIESYTVSPELCAERSSKRVVRMI
jgi:hypothetical protein